MYVCMYVHDGINSTLILLSHRLRSNAHRQQVKIIKRYSILPKVECFPGQLNQVFMNILTNAVDALDQRNEYGDEGPYIKISTAMVNRSILICIENNGVAIDAGIRDRVFEPFFTTKPVGEGAGLGLATSYQIVVNQHQGELRCRAGETTEFVIELPIGTKA